MHGERSTWRDGAFEVIETRESTPERRVVADSWLVRNGTVIGLDLHRKRFTNSVKEMGALGTVDLDGFWLAVVRCLPRTGHWFPRVELIVRGQKPLLAFELRPSPPVSSVARLVTHRGPDFRTVPATKGPDIDALAGAQCAGRNAGADDVVIVSGDGHIIDGTTTAILWWRNECVISPPLWRSRIDSVTARTILVLARSRGVRTAVDDARPSDLTGCVVWAVNALHGIRAVTSWIDGPMIAQDNQLTDAWRLSVNALARPL